MKYADELGIGDFLSSSLAVTSFAFVWFAFQQGMCAWIYSCSQCPLLTTSHLPVACHLSGNDFQQVNIHSAEIFLHILGESYLLEGPCRCRWSPLGLFHVKTRDGEQMKVLWTNSLTDPHAGIFCAQQCFKKTAGCASDSVNNLYNGCDLLLYHFIRKFF